MTKGPSQQFYSDAISMFQERAIYESMRTRDFPKSELRVAKRRLKQAEKRARKTMVALIHEQTQLHHNGFARAQYIAQQELEKADKTVQNIGNTLDF